MHRKELPIQVERTKAMKVACNEMTKILSNQKIGTALTRDVPGTTDNRFSIGDEVLMFGEELIAKWVGLYIV